MFLDVATCVDRENLWYPDPSICNKALWCFNGVNVSAQTCPTGDYFDVDIQQCVTGLQCGSDVVEPPTTTAGNCFFMQFKFAFPFILTVTKLPSFVCWLLF